MTTSAERLAAYRRTVVIIAVVVFLVLAFMIIRPFIIALIGAAVLAYLFYPVYKFLLKYMPKFLPGETISALITCFLIVLVVLIPMGSITGLLTAEIAEGYRYFSRMVSSPTFRLGIELPPFLARHVGDLSQYNQYAADFGIQVIRWLQNVAKGIPNVFLNIFITIISVYFFLKGGKNLYDFLEEYFPLPENRYKEIFARFDDLSRGMLMGQLVVGIMHGFLAWFAYSILGVANPVLWAFITAIISIIPVLGSGLVWGPIAIYLFVAGLGPGTYWKGLVLFVYGLVLMSTLDNVVKPKIIGQRSRIHPLIILFGILGGIQFLGLPGIIIGPLILGLFDVMLSIFREVI